jgi:uncharacterized protein (TIGR02646 family)
MTKFREKTPVRRTDAPIVEKYSSHRDSLQKDFNGRCGYCDDLDGKHFQDRPFHIDHFVPKSILKTISESEYSNLVWSCAYCNRAKWNYFPTQSETVHHNGKEGFIDPCDPLYDQQFERSQNGKIEPQTILGNYMSNKLHLYLDRHAIIWNLEKLNKALVGLENLGNYEELDTTTQEIINKLCRLWRSYTK